MDVQQAVASLPVRNKEKKDSFSLKKNHLHISGQQLIPVRLEPWTTSAKSRKKSGSRLVERRLTKCLVVDMGKMSWELE